METRRIDQTITIKRHQPIPTDILPLTIGALDKFGRIEKPSPVVNALTTVNFRNIGWCRENQENR